MYDPVADIDRLMDAARAAPSVLNTQPWLFQIVASDRISLRAQRARWLQHIDPEKRELAISSRERQREGIWRIAAVSTAAWSAKVFDPALPCRSSIASDSAVFASHAASGWKPYPFLTWEPPLPCRCAR